MNVVSKVTPSTDFPSINCSSCLKAPSKSRSRTSGPRYNCARPVLMLSAETAVCRLPGGRLDGAISLARRTRSWSSCSAICA